MRQSLLFLAVALVATGCSQEKPPAKVAPLGTASVQIPPEPGHHEAPQEPEHFETSSKPGHFETPQEPGHFEDPTSPSAYDTALKFLKEGKQSLAEDTLARAVQQDKTNQRVLFFMGVCARSRWMKREAWPIFENVTNLNAETPEAKCSTLMLAIDKQEKWEESFAALEKLQQSHPDDPLLLWMTAVACRELGRRGAPKVYSEKGAQYYAKLLETLNPGPAVLHQTCANILSEELGRHEEALKHREIAVALEPASWSIQGMANTLTHLGRYADADVNYKKCTEMAPDDSACLASWAWSMTQRKEYDKAFDLYKKAAALAPNYPKSWRDLSWCATKLNRLEDAAKYKRKAEALEKTQR